MNSIAVGLFHGVQFQTCGCVRLNRVSMQSRDVFFQQTSIHSLHVDTLFMLNDVSHPSKFVPKI